MAIAQDFQAATTLPVIVAPMFLISNPEMALAACREGFVGSFPSINAARVTGGLESWLLTMEQGIADLKAQHPGDTIAPYAVNLIVHKQMNPLFDQDLALCKKYKVPVVITSLGDPSEVVKAVHEYGGLVLSDVVNARHAAKAAAAGVDGLIAVSEDAGGHAGPTDAATLIKEIRAVYPAGFLGLAGGLTDGKDILAAQQMGADFAYMGTRFLATQESGAPVEYKEMITKASSQDLIYTSAISGTPGNFLRQSLERAGIDTTTLGPQTPKLANLKNEAAAWKAIWSAGHGIDGITDIPKISDLAQRLKTEYAAAKAAPAQPLRPKKQPKAGPAP